MKVFIAGKSNDNGYLNEILNHVNFEFMYGNLDEVDENTDILLFQWPEELVDWRYPSDLELTDLEEQLKCLKSDLKFAGFVHNIRPHSYLGANHQRLYNIVYGSIDLFFHFGDHSKNLFSDKYENACHVKVNHPLYRETLTVHDKSLARKYLNISNDDRIIIVPGKVRNVDEQKLIFKVLRLLIFRKVKLIVLQMNKQLIQPTFKGYYLLKRILIIQLLNNLYYCYHKLFCNFIFLDKRLSHHEMSLWLSASDGVWVARKDILNSGIFYLALTFDKWVIGPGIGNLKEHLITNGLPYYNNTTRKELKLVFGKMLVNMENPLTVDKVIYEPKHIAALFENHLFKL